MLRTRRTLTGVVVLLLAGGCAPRPANDAAAPPQTVITIERPAPEWSAAGLEDQPRMAVLRAISPPDFQPGATAWRAAAAPVPPAFRRDAAIPARRWARPGALVADLAAELGVPAQLGVDAWEVTTRVLPTDDRATGVILTWGLFDDAIAGHDLRINMRREAGHWFVEDIQERFQCRRGVVDGLCV